MSLFKKESAFRIKSGPGNIISIAGLDVTAKCRLNTETISIFKQRIDAEIIEYSSGSGKILSEADVIKVVGQAIKEKMGSTNEVMAYVKKPSAAKPGRE